MYKSISKNQANQMIAKNKFALIIDVRDSDLYNESHLKNSINIPLNYISDKLDFLNKYKNKNILIYCDHGKRSVVACQTLQSLGFYNLYNIDGGIE